MRSKLAATLLSLTLSTALLAGCGGAKTETAPAPAPAPTTAPAAKVLQIGITQIVEHPALDATRKGIIDALKAAGFEDGKQIKVDFQSAQGDMPTAQQIAQKFVADKKDLIVAIATPTAQAAVQVTKQNQIPVIFSAVTDPVGAGLVTTWEKPGANVTGTSDMLPVKDQLSLFQQLGAKVTKVGVIYNAGESNSVSTVKQTKEVAQGMGITIVEATVANASEVQQAAQSLVGRVDGLYLITDNTLAQGVQSVIALANDKKLPTISAVQEYVDQGALATLGMDYYQLGQQTGAMAAEVLKGKKPADIAVQTSKDLKLVVNTKAAKTIGLTVPDAILSKAEKVEK
jgi:putative tryptophan/tyrosine transport system substrate-binding protein